MLTFSRLDISSVLSVALIVLITSALGLRGISLCALNLCEHQVCAGALITNETSRASKNRQVDREPAYQTAAHSTRFSEYKSIGESRWRSTNLHGGGAISEFLHCGPCQDGHHAGRVLVPSALRARQLPTAVHHFVKVPFGGGALPHMMYDMIRHTG